MKENKKEQQKETRINNHIYFNYSKKQSFLLFGKKCADGLKCFYTFAPFSALRSKTVCSLTIFNMVVKLLVMITVMSCHVNYPVYWSVSCVIFMTIGSIDFGLLKNDGLCKMQMMRCCQRSRMCCKVATTVLILLMPVLRMNNKTTTNKQKGN